MWGKNAWVAEGGSVRWEGGRESGVLGACDLDTRSGRAEPVATHHPFPGPLLLGDKAKVHTTNDGWIGTLSFYPRCSIVGDHHCLLENWPREENLLFFFRSVMNMGFLPAQGRSIRSELK